MTACTRKSLLIQTCHALHQWISLQNYPRHAIFLLPQRTPFRWQDQLRINEEPKKSEMPLLKTSYGILAFLRWCSQSLSSEIKGTIMTNVLVDDWCATIIGTIDFLLPVGSATSTSVFPLIAQITAFRCSSDTQLQLGICKIDLIVLRAAFSMFNISWKSSH